jgi:hypothetical protein
MIVSGAYRFLAMIRFSSQLRGLDMETQRILPSVPCSRNAAGRCALAAEIPFCVQALRV